MPGGVGGEAELTLGSPIPFLMICITFIRANHSLSSGWRRSWRGWLKNRFQASHTRSPVPDLA